MEIEAAHLITYRIAVLVCKLFVRQEIGIAARLLNPGQNEQSDSLQKFSNVRSPLINNDPEQLIALSSL
jgi:hypothetical protein